MSVDDILSQDGGNAAVANTTAETATTETAIAIDTETVFVKNELLRCFLISNSAAIQKIITAMVDIGHKVYETTGTSKILTLALAGLP